LSASEYTNAAHQGGDTRILVITNMFPPQHLGGYELACRDAVLRWREHGHHVTVLTSDTTFAHASGPDTSGVIRELRLYWRDNLIVSPSIGECLRIERHNLRTFRDVFDEAHPDVVSFWHMGAVSLGLLTEVHRRGAPMVLVIGDQWLVYGPQVDAWMRRLRSRVLARVVGRLTGTQTTVELSSDAAVLFATDWLRGRTEQRSPLRLPDRRTTVYGGIDDSLFAAPNRSTFGWRLICAGRVETRKGIHVAIEAMAHLPEQAVLEIVGSWDDEAYVARLRDRAEALGLGERIRWRGLVPRSELAARIGEADVFLFPVVWDEPFGMAPLEAMACGTPVVATATGGSAEFLIDGVNCLRVPIDDPRAIAEKVRSLAADDHLRRRLVRAGSETAAYLSNDRYNDELEAWHAAAAKRFAEGVPPPRRRLEDVLGRLLPSEPPARAGQEGTIDGSEETS
jgi:glycosyltransferase involved in cell wall biosynthesis